MTLALFAASAGAGCTCGTREAPPTASSSAPVASAAAKPVPRTLPPLSAPSWRIDLPIPDFEPASVAVPLGARQPRPVVIALHGIADRAEWQCGTFTGITDAHPFVLCPRGVKKGNVETYAGYDRTAKELRAALAQLKQRFGDHVAPGPVILAGYSLGATHALMIAKQEPAFFSRLVLVEGGHAALTPTWAGVFARGGGKRVLFACGQSACDRESERRMLFVRRAGAEAELVSAPGVGHALESRLSAAIEKRWAWLVAGDARFEAKP